MKKIGKAVYNKVYNYTTIGGVEDNIILLPLTGDYLPTIFRIANKLRKLKAETEEQATEAFFNTVDSDTIKDIVEVTMATLDRSLPDESQEDKEGFCAQHCIKMITLILDLNIGSTKPK
jgi:hypothetical protein